MKKPFAKINLADLWFARLLACTAYLLLAAILDQYFRQEVVVFGQPGDYLQARIGLVDNLLAGGFITLCLALIFNRVCSLLLAVFRFFFRQARKPGKASLVILILVVGIYVEVVLRTQQNFSREFFLRWPLFLAASLCGAAALKNLRPRQNRYTLILAPFLMLVVLYRFLNYVPGITTYPLSLAWSETSNFFYASQFLAPKLYGLASPLPLINPGRALLSAVPFLLPQPQLWVNRLWEALLWAGLTTLTAVLITRRLKLGDRVQQAGLTAGITLFLYQGPIYYDLLFGVCLVLWLFKPAHFWRSLLVVAAASAWVGFCRLNWFPVPGVLAGLLYILEQPKEGKPWRSYLARPAAWVAVGLGVALAFMTLYAAVSGNGETRDATSLTSPLLWYRLFPNATYAWGVLPAALVTAFPALFLIGAFLVRQRRQWDAWRMAYLLSSLLVFFVGGIIVSLKIGGGGDLHNLDVFWILLAVLCSYLYFQRFPADRPEANSAPVRIPGIILVLLVALPVSFQLTQLPFTTPPQPAAAAEAIAGLRKQVAAVVSQGKPVLFISEKQLITFGQLPGTPMVFDNEKVHLMEMAMSGNTVELQKFYNDLKNDRFGLIVTDTQPGNLKPQSESFSDENNVQILRIGKYLNCYTQVTASWENLGLEVRTPRPVKEYCP